MRIKVKQMILIIVVSAVVYLVVGAMAPFIKYKEVSSQEGFLPAGRLPQRGNGHGQGHDSGDEPKCLGTSSPSVGRREVAYYIEYF